MTGTPLTGSHVERADVLGGAQRRNADVVQVHLSAPQSWRAPTIRGDEEEIAASGIPVFVHAPYLANPSSVNPELRERSRHCLQVQAAAASRIGARGLVVHGGHPTGAGTVQDAIDGWVDVLRGWSSPVPILVENTAGGAAGPARYPDTLHALLTAIRSAGEHEVGFCLDTCHAWAGGYPLEGVVQAALDAAGTIDLVHLNDSKDPRGSGRDRHENLGHGTIPVEWLVEVASGCGAPLVVETPGGEPGQAADVAWLRRHLAGG